MAAATFVGGKRGGGRGREGGFGWCRSHDDVTVTAELTNFPSKNVDDTLHGTVGGCQAEL